MMMKKGFLFFGWITLLCSCTSTAMSIQDPHNHVFDVHKKPWRKLTAYDIKLVRVEAAPDSRKEEVVLNQSKSIRAFVIRESSWGESIPDRILLEYESSGEVYEIQGIPFAHRPFSDLRWIEDQFLVFDRWSNPHCGIHYVVDALERKVLLAVPFPDQIFLDSNKKESIKN